MADKFPKSELPEPAPRGSQVFGNAPVQEGEIFLGERTRAQLQEFGWQTGDPIPPNFSKIIQVLREEYAADIEKFEKTNPQEANRARGGLFNFIGLPDAARKEIANVLAAFKNNNVTGTLASPAVDDTTDAYARFNPTVAEPADSGFVVDSMELPKKQLEPQPTREKISEDAEYIKSQIFGKPPETPAPVVETSNTEALVDTGVANNAQAYCPRCLWELRKPFPVEPTKDDIQNFVIAILGNKCFSKTYSLFGGRVTMHFQALSAKASAMVKTQLAVDVRKQRILEAGDYLATMVDYRMMFALRELYIPGSPPNHQIFADILTLTSKQEDETPLRGYVEVFYSDLVISESLIRIARQTAFEFGALCEKLEAMAIEPSFWNGIVV